MSRITAHVFQPANPAQVANAKILAKRGFQVGVHRSHGIVVFYNRQLWRVVGSDMMRPEQLVDICETVMWDEVTWVRP